MNCFLCGIPAKIDEYFERSICDCGVCGKFAIDQSVRLNVRESSQYPKLSTWTRRQSDLGTHVTVNMREFQDPPLVLAPSGVGGKLLRTLQWLAGRKPVFGESLSYYHSTDWPLISDEGRIEADALIEALFEAKYVTGARTTTDCGMVLTAAGWSYLESQKHLAVEPDLGFVAMRFSEELDPLFAAMKVAADRAGYQCKRVDTDPHADHIDHRLIDFLRRCRFVIADFTCGSENVYFEAGHAMGQKKPIIWTRRKGEEVKFDTRQYQFLEWEQDRLATFQIQLEDAIAAVVGRLKPRPE